MYYTEQSCLSLIMLHVFTNKLVLIAILIVIVLHGVRRNNFYEWIAYHRRLDLP